MIPDKRKSRRKKIQLKVLCHAADGSWAQISGHSFNISQVGIVLRVKKHFAEHKSVTLTISNPYWKEPVTAKCRVIWESGIPGTDEKDIGLEFTDVSWKRITQMWSVIKD